MSYHKDDKVKWQWGKGYAQGKISKTYTKEVTRKISGTEVKRKADSGNPAYLIIQDDGSEVLKSHSELEKV